MRKCIQERMFARLDKSQDESNRLTSTSMGTRCTSKSFLIELLSLSKIPMMLLSTSIIESYPVSIKEKIGLTLSMEGLRI